MGRKLKGTFALSNTDKPKMAKRYTIEEGLKQVEKMAQAENLRANTIRDYKRFITKWAEYHSLTYLDELTRENLLDYVNQKQLSGATRRIRLKACRAVLQRLYRLEILDKNWWYDLRIKVDEVEKFPTKESDIKKLFQHLDFTDYFQYRDACAILLIFQTGVRIGTLSQIRMSDVDLEAKLLMLPPEIMKGRTGLTLPLSDELVEMIRTLILSNPVEENDLIFISKQGTQIKEAFQKRLKHYSDEYGIENLQAHSLRRAFAHRLLASGVSVPVISKALGHKSLDTTTRYLRIDEAEMINELKRLW
jgi:integrase